MESRSSAAESKRAWHDISVQKNKFLFSPVQEGQYEVVKVLGSRLVEADDELAQKVR